MDNGRVTAVGKGTATITVTVTTEDGGKQAQCTVTVENKPVPVITLSADSHSLSVDGTAILTAETSNNPENKPIIWSNTNPLVARFDESTGKITAISAGTTQITASLPGAESKTCTVTVTAAAVTVNSITISPSNPSVTVGGTVKLSAIVSVTPNTASAAVTWSVTAGDAYASVDANGLVTGKAIGKATVTATSVADPTKKATCEVNVIASNIPVTGLSVKSSTKLSVGGTETLTATVLPANATNKAVTWSSSNNSVATVNATTGAVTAKAVGTAVITATSSADSSKRAACTVTVVAANIPGVTYSVASDKAATLSGSDFNNACIRATGYSLQYVTFSQNASSTNHGLLYYNYISDGNSDGKIPTGTAYYYNTSSNNKNLSKISFVPDSNYNGTATFSYTGYYINTNNGNRNEAFSGVLSITVNGPSGDISYKTGRNEPVSLSGSDFNSVCRKLTGSPLEYVIFGSVSSSKGALYYDYDGSDETRVNSTKYYYNDSPDIDDVSFVPYKNYYGTVTIGFTGRSTNSSNRTFSGSIEITVEKDGSSSIVYKTSKNESVDLKGSDFNTFCNDTVGGTLHWIEFTGLPSSSKGTLYYKYETSKEEEADRRTEYYYKDTPKIDDLTFVPDKNYSGTVTIDFDGENTNGRSFSGSFSIKVGASGNGDGDVTYTASAGSPVTFNTADFNSYCKSETGHNLDYVKFSLPSSSTGALYYEYDSASSSSKKVTSSTEYNRSSSPYLEKVTFVPAKSTAGDVTIRFSGRSTDKDNFSGTVTITYTAVKNASVLRYVTGGEAVTFKTSDFESACNARGAASLSSVRFNLPSTAAGLLYYNYVSDTQNGGLVYPTVDYSARAGSLSLSGVSFVPKAGFAGTVTLTYTGTDTKGATYTGSVEITVTQSNVITTPKFTDMGNAAWAAEAVNFIYQRGITIGTSPTTYNPTGKITRGDFILMLQRAFNLTAIATDNFKDVAASDYYAQAIAVVKAMGIAESSDGMFRPAAELTREDAMLFLQRAMSRTGRALPTVDVSFLDRFSDKKSVSSSAQSAVATLVQAGIIQGDNNGKLNPKGTLTRAEMAVVFYRVLNK